MGSLDLVKLADPREAASDIPAAVPALTLNRLGGSGLQTLFSAAQMTQLGEASITLACSAESMSNVPYHDLGVRWGRKMGANVGHDALTFGLQDAIGGYHMGVTAQNLAMPGRSRNIWAKGRSWPCRWRWRAPGCRSAIST